MLVVLLPERRLAPAPGRLSAARPRQMPRVPAVAPPPPTKGPVEGEELVDLPYDQLIKDKLIGARVKRQIGIFYFAGRVEDIEVGVISKERLYRIRYSDGDVEHFTAEQVREFADAGWRGPIFCWSQPGPQPVMTTVQQPGPTTVQAPPGFVRPRAIEIRGKTIEVPETQARVVIKHVPMVEVKEKIVHTPRVELQTVEESLEAPRSSTLRRFSRSRASRCAKSSSTFLKSLMKRLRGRPSGSRPRPWRKLSRWCRPRSRK